jgi:hypothetical protein
MTESQKKAKELIEKFSPHSHSDWHDDGGWNNVQLLENAKQCAIICVDEILKEIYSNNVITNDKHRIFWQQVKQEIINYKN